ncbi:MAG: hypothetical protein LBQ10_01230 [Desulfovibrio sp.]|jgi:hypothetical protein|nr:hypothetical protein [Desulfovibrio sp.]
MDEKTFRYEMAKQTNQSAIDYSLKMHNWLFLLNGAAATALLYSGKDAMLGAALWFACGAAIGIVSAFFAYVYTLLLVQTWIYAPSHEYDERYLPFVFGKRISERQADLLRLVPIVCGALSLVLFAIGVVKCAYKI